MQTNISGINFGDGFIMFGHIAIRDLFKSAEEAVFSGNQIGGKRTGATAIGGCLEQGPGRDADATTILDALSVEDAVAYEKAHD